MQKSTGWTKKPFIPCDMCLPNGRKFICQASKYTIHTKKGTKNYCSACADLIPKPPKKKIDPNERVDYEYMQSRDWYNNSSARLYV